MHRDVEPCSYDTVLRRLVEADTRKVKASESLEADEKNKQQRANQVSCYQCCGAATFLGDFGSGWPRSRSRLRLRPNWVGSGSRQKKAAPGFCFLLA